MHHRPLHFTHLPLCWSQELVHLTKTQLVFSWSLSSEEPPAWVQALRSGEEGFTPSRGGSSKWGITPILAAFPKFSLDIALKHHKYFYFYCLLSQFHSRANTDYITHTFIYKINSYIHKFIQDKWEAACKWAWAVITHLEHCGAGHPMVLGTPWHCPQEPHLALITPQTRWEKPQPKPEWIPRSEQVFATWGWTSSSHSADPCPDSS